MRAVKHSWGFSDDKEYTDKLINLVLSNKKVATIGLYKE